MMLERFQSRRRIKYFQRRNPDHVLLLIERHFDIRGHRTDDIKDVMITIIETYNSSSHKTLSSKTPNEVFIDSVNHMARHVNDGAHNLRIYQSETI